jgi:FkbM family methyltransferase
MHTPAETTDFWLHLYKPQPGDIILDIGAGQGEDLATFSGAVGPRGRVIAIEAHPTNVDALKGIIKELHLGNVDLVECAATSWEGSAYAQNGANYLENRVEQTRFEGSLEVQCRRVDDICKERGIAEIALIKMNIEGGEVDAIEGAAECLKLARYAVIACHDFRAAQELGEQFRTRDAVKARLTALGFESAFRDDAEYPWQRDHLHGRNTRYPE